MSRRNIGFMVFMMVVGFAAVATTLVINGNVNLSFDDREFTSNVVFTKAETEDGIVAINGNEQNIDFETKMLSIVGDTAVLNYEVTNKSRQYNASVTINCGLKDDFSSFNEYLETTNDLTSPFELNSAESKSSKVTVRLKKAYIESDAAIGLVCRLVASPIGRESVGEEYVEPVSLNGAEPMLDEAGKLVPVNITGDGVVTYANTEEEWYNYARKKWANAVILVDSSSKNYNVNDTIEEADIESYFVWIPRYRYQIFDKGEYTTASGNLPSESNAKEIQIVFEGKDTEVSTGSEVGDWLTHPAFTNYDTNGIWVGKFETGYLGATSESGARQNVNDASKVIIKPNVYSWRGITVSNIFKTALAYEESLTSHMMRNTEWGAVAYLSHSKYGTNEEVRINLALSFMTGYAANAYNTTAGCLASTTGNITGIYDMNGGAWEYVAGYRANTSGQSGFTTDELAVYANHFDIYDVNSKTNSYNYRILGDATGEMGPFYQSGSYYINNWYEDWSVFVSSQYPWFSRGGHFGLDNLAGQFHFIGYTGEYNSFRSFRITLAF